MFSKMRKSKMHAVTMYIQKTTIPLLIERSNNKSKRHLALFIIMATQKENIYEYNDSYGYWEKIKGFNYQNDTHRGLYIFTLIMKFIGKINIISIPWHIIKKINNYIAPNNVCNIFKKEALNDDYRMCRTYDEISSYEQTSGFSQGLENWVDVNPENVNRYGYNIIDDWRVGVRNGEIVSRDYSRRELKNLSDSRLPYPASYKKGYSYPDNWPTIRIYGDYYINGQYWDAPKGRGVAGDLIRPWHNREHDTFYVFNYYSCKNDTFWGSGPNKLVWHNIYNKIIGKVGLSNCLKTREFNIDTPPTELVFRKISSPIVLFMTTEYEYDSICNYIIKSNKNTNYKTTSTEYYECKWIGHNTNPIQECPMCIANTIEAVGNEESKKFRTRCIFTYPSKTREKIYEINYKNYPNRCIIGLPPLKRTGKVRQKERKSKKNSI